ncbi:MAG: hypothetical protein IJ719_21245 [Clostridia bacterium]|nr:hypothetical protein [Clostridia bacterium]
MSYDLYLRDPVTKEELQVPGHMMYGGNIACDYIGGQLVPTTTTRAYLNITYNYSQYYYDAFPGDDARQENIRQHEDDCKRYGIHPAWIGIRVLNGLSGAEAVPVLEEMIRRIKTKYKNPDGTWVISKRERTYFINRKTGQREGEDFIPLIAFLDMKKKCLTDEEAAKRFTETYEEHSEPYEMDEGSDGGSYWEETAANAIRPLYQLIALSRMRPDGVWSEES